MRYSAEKYEPLFEREIDQVTERGTDRWGWRQKLEHQAVGLYRTKRIVAGEYMELESYPVWEWQREATRAKKAQPTEAAQRAQNERDSRKKLVRLLNTNFTEQDLFITLTYAGEQPGTIEGARRDIQAFIRRVRRWREKRGLPELKYIYTIEYVGEDGRKKRAHHHIVMSGMDRDAAEELWEKGRANTVKLQPDEYGLEGMARYMTKTQGKRGKSEKTWSGSRNLKKPRVSVSDRKISKRDIELGIIDENALRERIQRREPGYVVNDITIKRSDFVAGAYVSVRLRKISPRGSPPKGKRGRGPDGET